MARGVKKMPWDNYTTASKKVGWVTKKAAPKVKVGKSPQTKLIEAIDFQLANLGNEEIGRKAWFRTHDDGDVAKGQVRYGAIPLKLSGSDYVELPSDKLEQFLKDIREAAVSGHFNEQLGEISSRLSAGKTKKA